MMQWIALKTAATLTAFLWAFVSIEKDYGAFWTFLFALTALGIGASIALDMARIAAAEWDDE